jgi:DNA-binding NarL/FixJ family response regulator
MLQVGVIEKDVGRRENLHNYFKNEVGFDCLMATATVVDFLRDLRRRRSRPDILLINFATIEHSDKVLPEIKLQMPNTSIVLLAPTATDESVLRAFYWGANGCLLQTTPMPEIKTALMSISQGGAALSPAVARQLISYFNGKKNTINTTLSVREVEVVRAMEQGKSHKEIAIHLQLSVETVRTHAKNIYKKLEVSTRAQVVAMSVRGQV